MERFYNGLLLPAAKQPMTDPIADRPKRFSMIREFHLADWFTLGNAVCGVGALFSAMTYLENGDLRHVYFAAGRSRPL